MLVNSSSKSGDFAQRAARVATNAVGEKIGKSIKTAELSTEKDYISNQAARLLTDEIKNQTTTKPKPKE